MKINRNDGTSIMEVPSFCLNKIVIKSHPFPDGPNTLFLDLLRCFSSVGATLSLLPDRDENLWINTWCSSISQHIAAYHALRQSIYLKNKSSYKDRFYMDYCQLKNLRINCGFYPLHINISKFCIVLNECFSRSNF